MTDDVWLVITRNGVREMRKREPSDLSAGQRAVRIRVSVPDSAFNRPPVPTATIDIPESALRLPAVSLDVALSPEPVRGETNAAHTDGTVEGTPGAGSSGPEPESV